MCCIVVDMVLSAEQAMVAFERASRLMVQFVGGGGGPPDRDSAIDLLEQAIDSGVLPAEVRPSARAALGSLLSLRVVAPPDDAMLPGADPLEFVSRSRTGPPIDSPQARADIRRAIHHLKHVTGTLADDVRGPLDLMELFARVADLELGGETFARVEAVLAEAVRHMSPASRRDLLEGLHSVLGDTLRR
jgi:hypothetical protein